MRLRTTAALSVLAVALAAPPAHANGDPSIAALQVALRSRGLYGGPVDGLSGPATARAVRVFQRHHRLTVDGVVGPQTRRALGRFGRHRFGSRLLATGKEGWDVAALQFALAWHGFPSGVIDGVFGPHTEGALLRFQRWARLKRDGHAGPATFAALRAPPARSPLLLAWPLGLPISDPFGPRGNSFHTGIDIPAATGTPVAAAGAGRVAFADWFDGYGQLVVVAHGSGARTFYAHLSSIGVRVGQRVSAGTRVGAVGATGHTTGPHLHFVVRVRGAAVDPLTALR